MASERSAGAAATAPLAQPLRSALEARWSERLGREIRIATAEPVGGGCISRCARVAATSGESAFLKWSDGDVAPSMFAAEERSLRALAAADAVRVPTVLARSPAGQRPAWLLLEWLEPGRAARPLWSGLGRGLARLHRTTAERWGWPNDNFIGTLPQPNPWSSDWPEFWRSRRLEPQLRAAADAGHLDRSAVRRFEALLRDLDGVLAGAAEEGPSLLHGDLWRGNVHPLQDGSAAVVDPSSYYGHREVDLAMSELFGGFDVAFYRAYDELWPLQPGYRASRRAVYQLYYLLVHVNLFGAAYVGGTLSALDGVGF